MRVVSVYATGFEVCASSDGTKSTQAANIESTAERSIHAYE
ncbi:Uncharacterised protein [Bordetella pertussis]|nr:Uncharacterised protein [Bordetella pertussis]